jgi:hypothetical protein
MKKGFWTHVQEIGPSIPGVGTVRCQWSITVADLRDELQARGLSINAELLRDLLLQSNEHCPGFPWAVTQLEDGPLVFQLTAVAAEPPL